MRNDYTINEYKSTYFDDRSEKEVTETFYRIEIPKKHKYYDVLWKVFLAIFIIGIIVTTALSSGGVIIQDSLGAILCIIIVVISFVCWLYFLIMESFDSGQIGDDFTTRRGAENYIKYLEKNDLEE